ncbi:MAG: hypothetical protein ABI425_03745 [Patescibacteria group bacterium]
MFNLKPKILIFLLLFLDFIVISTWFFWQKSLQAIDSKEKDGWKCPTGMTHKPAYIKGGFFEIPSTVCISHLEYWNNINK